MNPGEDVGRLWRHCHVVELAGADLRPEVSISSKLSYAGYRFHP
jgi:hypothetical protein